MNRWLMNKNAVVCATMAPSAAIAVGYWYNDSQRDAARDHIHRGMFEHTERSILLRIVPTITEEDLYR